MFRKITVFITLILMLLAVNINLFAQEGSWEIEEYLDERGFSGRVYQGIWHLHEIGKIEFEINTRAGEVKVISCQITLKTDPELVVNQTLIRMKIENGEEVILPAIGELEELRFKKSGWLAEETIFFITKKGELKPLNQEREKVENDLQKQPFISLIIKMIEVGKLQGFPSEEVKETIHRWFLEK